MRFGWIAAFCLLPLAACSPAKDTISLSATGNQQAIVRDGVPALVSSKKHVVFLRPTDSQQLSNDRPRFVVAMYNRGKAAATFNFASIQAQSARPVRTTLRVYSHAELAQEVEDQRNTALFLSALSGVAGAVSASQAGYTHTTGSIGGTSYSATSYSPALAQAAGDANVRRTANDMASIQGQAEGMLSQLQASILKDHTLMPGEWHGGVIVLQPPEKGDAGAAEYTVSLVFDGEEHTFTINQRKRT